MSAVRRTVAVTASSAALVVLGACGEVGPGSREAAVPSSSQPGAPSGRAPSDGGDQEWPEPARGAYDVDHPYVGTWVTQDGGVRQELLADGRYQEARGTTEKAYTGRYRVVGEDVYYVDDTGFTADGHFSGDVLHHGGMVMARRWDDR